MPENYTPGPWRVVCRSGEYWVAAGESDKDDVARFSAQTDLETVAANATLIAMAPDMYEALADIARALSESGEVVIRPGTALAKIIERIMSQ